MLQTLLDNLYGLLGGLAILVAGAWHMRSQGKKSEQAKQAKQEVDAIERAKQIDRDVDRSSADERRSELFDKYGDKEG